MGHQQGYTMSIVGPVCHSSAWACCDWPAFQTFQSPKMRQCFGQKAISISSIVLMTVYNYCLDNMLQLSNGKTLKVVSPELLMSWLPLYFTVEHICRVLPFGVQNLKRLNEVWPIGCPRKTLFQKNKKRNPPRISLGVSLNRSKRIFDFDQV